MTMKIRSIDSLPHLPVLLTLCMAIAAAATPTSAAAQSWRIEPVVRVGGEYDDNATLDIRTDTKVELEGFLVDLLADVTYSSATTSFFFQPRVLIRNYLGDPGFDSDDYFLRSRFSHEGQSSTIGFRASFDQQTVRTAERAIADLDIDDPEEITDDDTGRIVLLGDRSKWRISPFWDYRLSNISTLGADFDYFDVRYEDVLAGLLTDYTDARLNLNYRRAFSNVQTGLLTVSARRYDSVATLSDITGYGLMVGFERALSQKMSLAAMIGFEDTRQSGLTIDPEPVGYINLVRNLETIRVFAQYRRSVAAGGAGRLSIRNSLYLNFRRRLNEKISAGLGVRAYQSRGIGGAVSIDDRDYVQLQSTFLWYLSTSFVIEFSYRYTVSDRSVNMGERSISNRINLWFTYQPRTIPKL